MKRFMAAVLSLVLAVGVIVVPAYGEEYATYGEFQYRNNGDHITITGYTGTGPDMVIPDYIDGLPVTGIAGITFDAEDGSVGRPEIEMLVLPSAITYFDTQLLDFKLPNLKNIYVAEENPVYKDVDGVLFSKDGKTLVYYPVLHGKRYVIPQGTEEIAGDSFDFSEIQEVVIPEGVTYIGDGAFAPSDLKYIKLPSSVETVKSNAFHNCSEMEWAYIPADAGLGPFAFMGCTGLQKVVVTGQLESISFMCFHEVPETCDFYFSSYNPGKSVPGNIYYLSEGEESGVMAAVVSEEEETLSAFTGLRTVALQKEVGRRALQSAGIDDRLLANIHTASFADAVPAEGFHLLLPVGEQPAEEPVVYLLEEDGSLQEMESSRVAGWAVIEDAQEGVYLTLQKGAAMGDLDGDGNIDISDVMALCRVIARESAGADVTDTERQRGDLDGDGIFTISDVMNLCKVIALGF